MLRAEACADFAAIERAWALPEKLGEPYPGARVAEAAADDCNPTAAAVRLTALPIALFPRLGSPGAEWIAKTSPAMVRATAVHVLAEGGVLSECHARWVEGAPEDCMRGRPSLVQLDPAVAQYRTSLRVVAQTHEAAIHHRRPSPAVRWINRALALGVQHAMTPYLADALAEELARVDMQPEVLDLRAPKALAVQRPSIPPMLGAWAPYAGKIPAQIARLWNVV